MTNLDYDGNFDNKDDDDNWSDDFDKEKEYHHLFYPIFHLT